MGSKEVPVENNQVLEKQLKDYLKTGQKTNALIIHSQEKSLNEACLRVIKNINPLKLVLVGNWKKEAFDIKQVLYSMQNNNKWKNWDVSALTPHGQPANKYGYTLPKKSKIVNSVEEALSSPRPAFFSPKHAVYVVQEQAANNSAVYKATEAVSAPIFRQ